MYDDIVVGGGHNGLAAAAYLARAGRRVLLLEKRGYVGGAAVSAQPFVGVDARLSRYAYLVSLLPHQVCRDLELDIRLVRRRFSSYTPDPGDPTRGVLIDGDDAAATRAAVNTFADDWQGWTELSDRMGRLARSLWPTLLEPLRSADQLAAVVDDSELWDLLTRRPLGQLLRRFIQGDLLRGVAATDGLIGTFASVDDPSLVQNICYLYHLIGGGTGDWDVPVGGMGAVTRALQAAAVRAGVTILTDARVRALDPEGVVLVEVDGAEREVRAPSLVVGCAPAVLDELLAAAGADPVDSGAVVGGAQLKINMMLTRLPKLRDQHVDPAAAFAGTFHVNESLEQLELAYRQAAAGQIPALPPCEIYCHTLSDRSILGSVLAGSPAQSLTLFGLHMPVHLFTAGNDLARQQATAATLRSLNTVLAEPIESVLMHDRAGHPCLEARTPVDLERDLDLPGGNIFHRPLRWPWAETAAEIGTWGVETPYPRVVLCGAGARRGGGVSAISGHNAARAILS